MQTVAQPPCSGISQPMRHMYGAPDPLQVIYLVNGKKLPVDGSVCLVLAIEVHETIKDKNGLQVFLKRWAIPGLFLCLFNSLDITCSI